MQGTVPIRDGDWIGYCLACGVPRAVRCGHESVADNGLLGVG